VRKRNERAVLAVERRRPDRSPWNGRDRYERGKAFEQAMRKSVAIIALLHDSWGKFLEKTAGGHRNMRIAVLVEQVPSTDKVKMDDKWEQ